jgi:hypothetical protein
VRERKKGKAGGRRKKEGMRETKKEGEREREREREGTNGHDSLVFLHLERELQ